jgi:hypothetical protein
MADLQNKWNELRDKHHQMKVDMADQTPHEVGISELLATIKNLQKALHDIEQSLQVHSKHTISGYYNPKADNDQFINQHE